jgi:choline dehydrogenase
MRAPNTTNIKEEVGAFSSTGGPLHVSYPKFGNPASTYAEVAFKRAGFPVADGFSGGVLNGSTWNPFTVNPDDGTRSSSETSFLQSTLRNGSANLKLYIQTQAMNIIFNETKTAMGVNVSSGDLSWVLSAKKEVIVSAGAVSLSASLKT